MDKLMQITGLSKIRVLYKYLTCYGGPWQLFEVAQQIDDVPYGDLVGTDELGNRYYENSSFFFGRDRWVVYNIKFNKSYDASMISPEWYGWIHRKTDLPPYKDLSRPKHRWMIKHTPNFSGTKLAYYPYSTPKPKIESWTPPQ
ncbi:NADH dehydrogenase [ubiquinone] 1 alpha subcomplex subunit 12 [Prorops nasuta]|uniref:NADH dehydrogenase [ubiquinone] 1 alpha subcomplex subunit 12 n=1 Tax=Prorops nasuta TaxID=863751 RepID=UPI0034CFD8D7